jgi:hypothetical protein
MLILGVSLSATVILKVGLRTGRSSADKKRGDVINNKSPISHYNSTTLELQRYS